MVEKRLLPIPTEPADIKTSRAFDLKNLLEIESETTRVGCTLGDIQNFLRDSGGCIIPRGLTDQLQYVATWQIVYEYTSNP